MTSKFDSLDAMASEIDLFCKERDWDQFHGLKDLAIGAVTEASELLELFRFKNEIEINELIGEESFREALSDELADTLYFILRLADKADISLGQAFIQKMKKNREKYPVANAKGSNQKYDKL